MTQQYQFTTADYASSVPAKNQELSTASRKGLDSMRLLSNTVPATGNPSSRTITQEENMLNLRLLNIDQVCDSLNMGRVKVYELIKCKRLKSVKIGKRRLVSTRAVNDFIDQLEANHAA